MSELDRVALRVARVDGRRRRAANDESEKRAQSASPSNTIPIGTRRAFLDQPGASGAMSVNQ